MKNKTIYLVNEIHRETNEEQREKKIAERLAEVIKANNKKIKYSNDNCLHKDNT